MTVIVTAIGSMSSECVISSLIALGYDVVGTDIYPVSYHPISRQCRAFYQVPRADNDEYTDVLLKIARDHQVDFLLPLTDPEVDAICARRCLFVEFGVKVLLSSNEVIGICRNKIRLADALGSCSSFHVIPTFQSIDDAVSEFGNCSVFVAKKVNGRSSEGIIFGSAREIDVRNHQGYVFQPFIEGRIITVDVVVNDDGMVAVCPREELQRTKNGAGTVVQLLGSRRYHYMVSEVVKKICIRGCVNIEFIETSNDGCYLMDINPRFSAGIGFSAKMGFDAVALHLGAFGLVPFEIPKIIAKEGDIFVKRYSEFVARSYV